MTLSMLDEEEYLAYLRSGDAESELAEHLARGGTFRSHEQQWRQARDAAAAARTAADETVFRQVLALPCDEHGSPIAEALVELLARFWDGQASQKYGATGESDWRYGFWEPLATAGLIPSWRDGYGIGHRADGSTHPEDRDRAIELIAGAIRMLWRDSPTAAAAARQEG